MFVRNVLEMEKRYQDEPDPLGEIESNMDLRNTSVLYYLFQKHWLPPFRQYLFRTDDLAEIQDIVGKW